MAQLIAPPHGDLRRGDFYNQHLQDPEWTAFKAARSCSNAVPRMVGRALKIGWEPFGSREYAVPSDRALRLSFFESVI